MDPITFELIQARLGAATDEMAISLRQAAFSAAAREMMDFSTAICDLAGRTIAQGVGLAIQLGLIPASLPQIVATTEEPWADGDVLLLNHPYVCGAHLNDLMAVSPIFLGPRHIGFAATILHHLDVGGRVPGSIAADNRQIFEDGLQIHPTKIMRAGEWDEDVVAIFCANVRTPEENMGDLRAQIAALRRGERELREVCITWGVDTVQEYFEAVQRYSADLARKEIAALPDGEFSFEDWIDEDGLGSTPVLIRATIRVRGDQLTVDYGGSAGQRECGINSPLNSTRSITYAAVRGAIGRPIPENSGFYDAIEITAPERSIVNAQRPVAIGSRGLTLYRVADALFGALAQLVPNRVGAAGDGGALMLVISGRTASGKTFVMLDLVSAGWGGRPNADGLEAAPHIGVNHANTPVEVIEAEFPIRIEQYGFVPDTGGPGKFRGALSTVRGYTMLDDVVCVVRSDRQRVRPWGLAGGHEGAPSRILLVSAGGEITELPTKIVIPISAGQTLRYVSPSGGGWGDPAQRDPALVERDLVDGKVSLEHARSVYGWNGVR